MGAAGIAAQVLLLRELLVVFQGDELVVGVILANWMALEALGSFLAALALRRGGGWILFPVALLLFCLALPGAWLLARALPWVLEFGSESFSLPWILLGSLLALAPVALPHGMLFAAACSAGRGEDVPRRVYFWEIVGTVAGGVALNFVLIPFVKDYVVVAGVSLAGLVLLAVGGAAPRVVRAVAGVAFVAFVAALSMGAVGGWAWRAAGTQFPGQELLGYVNSPYGNVAVARLAGQQTLFVNRSAAVTAPTPDVASVEEYAHLPMFCHGPASNALILSGAAGGLAAELEKYPGMKVTCAELDPELFRALRRHPTELTTRELDSPGLRVELIDSCRLVNHSHERYDLVYLAADLPRDLLANRLFTLEFQRSLSRRLNPRGVVACALPFSLVYPEENLRRLLVCLSRTFRAVYPEVLLVPGEDRVYLLASNDLKLGSLAAADVRRQAEALRPDNLIMDGARAAYLFDPYRMSRLAGFLVVEGELNRRFHPEALRYAIPYLSAQAGWTAAVPGLGAGGWGLFGRLSLLAALSALPAALGGGRRRQLTVGWLVFSGGFCAMAAQLFLVFSFQALHGVLFLEIGLLVTAFMLGSAVGNRLSPRFAAAPFAGLLNLELLTAAALVFVAVAVPFSAWLAGYCPFGAKLAVVAVCLLPGMAVGAQYPVALRAWEAASGRNRPGAVYALDLLGSCLAGYGAGALLLPALGLFPSMAFLVLLKIAGAALVKRHD